MGSSSEHTDDVGSRVGDVISERYKLLEKIGEGGVAVVYRGEHTLMHRPVAVKVLRPEALQEPELVERFQLEARAVARLDHPNICGALDFGRLGDQRFFLVMEFLEGQSLLDIIDRDAPLRPERATRITIDVAHGLAHAHETGVVHRDLKPANVQVIEDGSELTAKIMDFGFARLSASPRLTRSGMTMGTPTYMSPELSRAEEADGRSDLYTLGIILFEMLTDDVPFRAHDTHELLEMHRHAPAPTVWEIAPGVPTPYDLGKIVDRLLKKDPDDRFESAKDVVRALRRADLSPYRPATVAERSLGRSSAEANAAAGDATDEPAAREPEDLGKRVVHLFRGMPADAKLLVISVIATMALLPMLTVVSSLLYFSGAPYEDEEIVFATNEVEPIDPSLEGERRLFIEDNNLAPELKKRDSNERAKWLESREHEWASNPHFYYLLGTAQWDADKRTESLAAYRRAVELDSRYAADQNVVGRAAEALSRKSLDSDLPVQFMTTLLEVPEAAPAVRESLFDVGVQGHWNGRKRARQILQKTGHWKKLPEWQRVALDLRLTGRDCERVRRLVNRLAEIGNPEAVAVLARTSKRPKSGCGFFDRKDCYACMRDDLDAAIASLEQSNAP